MAERQLRILHVIGSVAPRLGGPSNVLGLARALARQGCDVSLFSTDLDEQGQLWPWRQPHRLEVPTGRPTDVDGVTVQYFPANWPSRWACSLSMAAALREAIPTFDIVHIHSLYLFHGLAAAHYCRRARVPYIIRPHGTLDAWHRQHRQFQKALYGFLVENRNLRHAAAIHYTSAAEAAAARETGVVTPGFVVPQGVSLEEFYALPERGEFRRHHPELANRKLVVFLGRISEKKGFDLLIPAIAQVARSHPDIHLVIAGPDDEGYGQTARNLLQQHGLNEHATWTGMLLGEEKKSLLRDADVWALTSHDENFGVAVAEAMAAGAAVVITKNVGISLHVQKSASGLVCDPTIASVSEAIETLLADPSRREEAGQRAREYAMDSLSWDSAARSLLTEYEAIVSTRRRVTRGLESGERAAANEQA